MTRRRRRKRGRVKGQRRGWRAIFWPLFLSASLVLGIHLWRSQVPQRVSRNLKLLEHPNAKVASRAWVELNNLFFTKWVAYYLILQNLDNRTPISFLIQRPDADRYDTWKGGPSQTIAAKTERARFSVHGRPIFYKADRIYCTNIREALLAIAYNEGKGKKEFLGDWDAWWRDNRAAYDG